MRVIISGGGTAGHINPGIAIANLIMKADKTNKVVFIGNVDGMEKDLVPKAGYEIELFKMSGFNRKNWLSNFKTLKNLLVSIIRSRKFIINFRPDIVIGTGGYVCGPILFNAYLLKLPTIIHEQNVFPGMTNKILSHIVTKIAISFEETRKYFKNEDKLFLSGNPIRSEFMEISKQEARDKLGISKDEKVVLIFGGSIGAKKINHTTTEMIIRYFKADKFKIIFATGQREFETISERLNKNLDKNILITPYIYNMPVYLNAADLVISRSGALTVSELLAVGTKAILIPSPNVTANHQEFNARVLEKRGAIVILEKHLNPEILYQNIERIIEKKDFKLEVKKEDNYVEASKIIYEQIIKLVRRITFI